MTLPCGCIQGEFQCPEAERLWDDVYRAYSMAKQIDEAPNHGLWQIYESSRKAYAEHVEEDRDTQRGSVT
jgi:hypothetical protein